MYNNLWQIRNVSFLNTNTHLFKRKLYSGSQALWSHMRRKFSVVIEATYEQSPQFHRHWQIFVQSFLKVVETCDNLMKLHPKHMGGRGLGELQISAARLLQGRHRAKQTRVTMYHKNPPPPVVPCSVHYTVQTFSCNVLTPSDYKKRITARCSTTVQFDSGAAIFKDLQTNNTLTKPDNDPSRHCSYCDNG